MRIAIIDGAFTYWLAGDPTKHEREHTSVADREIRPARAKQTNQYIRGPLAKVVDRKNLLVTLTFTTHRNFDSVEDADLFCTDTVFQIPNSGTLLLRTPLAGGGNRDRYMPSCVVDPPLMQQTGSSVKLTYTVQAGAITTTPS